MINNTGLASLKTVIHNETNLNKLCIMVESINNRYNKSSTSIPSIESCIRMSKELSRTPGFNEIFGNPRLMRALIVSSNMYTHPDNIKDIFDNYQMTMYEENTSSDNLIFELVYSEEILKHFKLVGNIK